MDQGRPLAGAGGSRLAAPLRRATEATTELRGRSLTPEGAASRALTTPTEGKQREIEGRRSRGEEERAGGWRPLSHQRMWRDKVVLSRHGLPCAIFF